jgi:hypothetical protein
MAVKTSNLTQYELTGPRVITVMNMKSTVFWDITPCSLLKGDRLFGGRYRLHLQVLGHAGFLLSLFFDSEVGGGMFLQNVG